MVQGGMLFGGAVWGDGSAHVGEIYGRVKRGMQFEVLVQVLFWGAGVFATLLAGFLEACSLEC